MYKYWLSLMKYICFICMLISEVLAIVCLYEQNLMCIVFVLYTIMFLIYTLKAQEFAEIEWTYYLLCKINKKLEDLLKEVR